MKWQPQQLKKSPVNLKDKDFKALEDLWYAKLKKSGFEDIETPGDRLKWSTAQAVARAKNQGKPDLYESKEEYYRMAGHFLHDHVFEGKAEKYVWEYHAVGKSMRDISKLLKKSRIYMATTQVKETIHRLRDIMFKRYRGEDHE